MPIYTIRGVDVDFPFDAYDCQITYMDRVLESLQQGKNALLESPTGTGKTLCLLCASLAWRRSFGEFLRGGRGGGGGGASQPSSSQQLEESPSQHRSATQLQSPYPVIIYASRTHSQLRQVIKELKATSYRPKMAVLGSREQMCIHDEVRTLCGRAQNNACHYLCKKRLCRHQNHVADYMRNNTDLGTEPFDIEDLVNIARSKGPSCVAEAHECIKLCAAKRSIEDSADKQFDPENYAILKALLLSLEKKISELVIESKELGYTKAGSYIYEFLSELNITSETSKKLIETIDSASLLIEEVCSISFAYFTEFSVLTTTLNLSFQFHVNESQQTSGDALKVLGLAMEEFLKLGVRSIILTSGTLSPLESLAMELNLEFPVRLENPHVISPDQIWVGVVPVGPSGHALNSSYRTRETIQYKQELGSAIVNFARIVPDGLLVFFPSYSMMDKCVEFWKNRNHANSLDEDTIWQRICKHKKPVIEPRQSSNFPSAIQVSEGLDFADRAGRAVIVTGMPFATPTDPKVRLKREYLDKQNTPSTQNTKSYSKYGEVVQGLTRFFKDKATADPVKLKQTECNDRVASLTNKCMAHDTLSDLAGSAQNELVTRRSNFMKLAQITPANRSTLSMPTSQLFSSKDQLSQNNLVDLTADTSIQGHMKDHTFKALRLKKAKIMDRLKDAVCFDDGCTKLPQNVELRAVARNFGERSTPQLKKSTTEQACEKNETDQATSEGQEAYSGPAFLKLVCCSFAEI
ncbi:hypothetical protein PR202_ga10634 [Eleusine coracana subsp. coracana]|uniref:Helicase ATP-binding domain-containing protein n=1 Tax=Eleusine coracana subsp. coracana TaxID=191504 RepID=A0AAV5C7A9_ELECO|nr:hypothetical protein PR202_ga10634 [Eleusine coracana subsp. coracana]